MNKIFFIIISVLSAHCLSSPFGGGALFAQQTCPQIQFTYDASGNRVQRKLVVVLCAPPRIQENTPPAPDIHANAFPNPANDKINIELEAMEGITESTIKLYDLSGKEIYSVVTPALQLQVDVSKLTAGTYLLKITRGKGYKTFNVLKN